MTFTCEHCGKTAEGTPSTHRDDLWPRDWWLMPMREKLDGTKSYACGRDCRDALNDRSGRRSRG